MDDQTAEVLDNKTTCQVMSTNEQLGETAGAKSNPSESFLENESSRESEDQLSDDGTHRTHLSKTERKQRRFEKILENKKRKRKDEKARKKLKSEEGNVSTVDSAETEERVSKRDQVRLVKERQIFGKECGQRICVDLNLEEHMSKKECSRLAQQIGRLYGSNKKAEIPAHIILTGIDKSGFLYNECVRKNSGFENYIIDIHEERHTEVFDHKEIVYLSPDSSNVLDSVEHEKVYIIGGLVDETVSKHITQTRANESGITTARLPIEVYMDIDQRAKGNHNKILTINQVFDILLTFVQTRNWRAALPVGVPRRKGYILRSDI